MEDVELSMMDDVIDSELVDPVRLLEFDDIKDLDLLFENEDWPRASEIDNVAYETV